MRILPYSLLDVFAERPLAGNPLAVFTDARALSTQEMQALALETNLSETTFIVPRPPEIERENGIQVRIFTIREELPFAGHPTLGTATWLHLNHPVYRGATRIVLDLSVGHIPVDFEPLGPEPGVVGSMRQNDPHFGQMHLPGAIADALGLNLDDLDPTLPIQTVSTGLPFCIVPLRSLEVAHRLAIPQHRALQYLAATDAKFFHCVTRSDPASGTNGTPVCSSITAKIPQPAQPAAALQRTWCSTRSLLRVSPFSSNRESRCSAPAAFWSMPKSVVSASPKFVSVAAPFPLQRDAFSCPILRLLHRLKTQTAANDAEFERTVNAQPPNPPIFAISSLLPRQVTPRTVGKRSDTK